MMGPRIFKVGQIGNGFLAIMAKPATGEWFDEEFAGIVAAEVKQIVSLLEPAEAYELGLVEEDAYCDRHGLIFLSFPIPDRGLPSSPTDFFRFTRKRHADIAEGLNTVVHCRAGIGRAGLVAAGVLLHAGFDPEAAFAQISKSRGVRVPDTDEQHQWLVEHQHEIEA